MLLGLHLAATWLMVGLIWTIQLVHYPLFLKVGEQDFADYESGHTRRMGRLLAVPAVAEVVLAALVFIEGPGVATAAAGAVLAGIWIMTALVHVPLHRRLADGYNPELIARLTTANWWRTWAWSVRGAIALILLLEVVNG